MAISAAKREISNEKLISVLQKQLSEQSQRISLLLEVTNYQNQAIKSCKAIDHGHMENAIAADICIQEMVDNAIDKADKEAA